MNARRPLLLALLLLSLAARADLVVVVNADNPTPALSREEVIHIFLGRYRQFPSGQGAEPYDQPTDSPERNLFYERLVGKSQAQINAYWARLTFTGRTRPPPGRQQPGSTDRSPRPEPQRHRLRGSFTPQPPPEGRL